MSNEQVASGYLDEQGLGEDPLTYFTRVFLLFLQGLFNDLPEGSYRWSDDERLAEIAITDQVPIPRERTDQKPHIVSMLGPAQFSNLSLDQMRKLDWKTGEKERTDLIACTMTLNCLFKNGVEARKMGFFVASHIRTFKTLLQRTGMHKVGDDLVVGPESPPGTLVSGEPDPELVLVVVQVPFFFQWTARDRPINAALLRSIELRLQSALLPAAATTTAGSVEARTALRSPTIRGRAINQPSVSRERVGEITQKVKT